MQDVTDALCRVLGEDSRGQVEVTGLRPAFSGTFTCIAKVPWNAKSGELVRSGRLCVGFMRCRVRSKTEVKKCFRCFGYGHTAVRCTEENRKGLCMGCGESGHVAKSCTKPPHCLPCAEHGRDADHRSGGNQCEAFKQALKNAQQ